MRFEVKAYADEKTAVHLRRMSILRRRTTPRLVRLRRIGP